MSTSTPSPQRSRSPLLNVTSSPTSTTKKRKRDEVSGAQASSSYSIQSDAWSALAASRGRAGWTYHLEIKQEPVRARACGFGNKDRRPLTPTPIIQLTIRDSLGAPIDIGLIDPETLILQVELVSVDGQEGRNIVRHPIGSGSTATVSKPGTSWTGSEMLGNLTTSPRSECDTASGPNTKSQWNNKSYDINATESPRWPNHFNFNTPYQSPKSSDPHFQPALHHSLPPSQRPGSSDTVRRDAQIMLSPPRPSTAPSIPPSSWNAPAQHRQSFGQTLPPLPAIAEYHYSKPYPTSLPSLYQRSSSSSSSWSRARSSQSTEMTTAPFEYSMARPDSVGSSSAWYAPPDNRRKGHPPTGPWPEEERQVPVGYMSEYRQSKSSDETVISPRSGSKGHLADSPYTPTTSSTPYPYQQIPSYSSATPQRSSTVSLPEEQPRYFTQPNRTFTQVLVGRRHANCNLLQDQNGESGLFFFATDLGVRTEGRFRLLMKVVDLSLFAPVPIKGQCVPVLTGIVSEPIDVFSAKRFPGVIPTTALTRYFAAQGIKLAVRENHKKKRGKQGEGEEDEGDDEEED